MGKYTRGLLAVMLAVVLVLPAAAFAMLPEANARSSTGMDGPEATKIVDHDTSNHWKFWAGGYDGSKVTTQNVGRIWTDKTVQAIDDGKSDFLTTLSAMSSTSDTTSLVSKPLDIVMVLDASGSMDDPMGGEDSPKRIDALKNAANHFIDTIAEQNKNVKDASKQHQVAIVKFAGEKTDKIGNDTYRDGRHSYNYSQTMQKLMACSGDGAKSLKKTINSIDPAGATRADNGMALAEGITSKREDAQKIVVFFTDGTPTDFRDFSSTVADNAIAAAKGMKDKGATVYTIGIFDGADPSADPTSYKTSDENKFMHAMSSNYPKATSYTSGKLGDRVAGATYYKSAANAAELDQVFADISSAITSGKGFPTKVEGNNPNASAILPVAGAYIGAIVSALLLVMVSPIKALVFLVFLVILQQIEGNVIYPKVVGTSIGLPGIWVLAAVTIGGGVGGLVGVLLSVPVASVLYALLRRDVHKRLACKE